MYVVVVDGLINDAMVGDGYVRVIADRFVVQLLLMRLL